MEKYDEMSAETAALLQRADDLGQDDPDWTMDNLQPLGEQWLEWSERAGDTEDPQTAIALSQRLEELEAQLSPDFLAGLSVALEWHLKQALEQAQMVEWYGDPPKAQVGGWCTEDVISCGQQDCEVDLTEDQAHAILMKVEEDMNATVGINWTIIELAIRDWLDEHPGEAAAYEEEEDA